MMGHQAHILDGDLPERILRAGGEGVGAALGLAAYLGVQGQALAGQHRGQGAIDGGELPAHHIMGVGTAANAAQGERGHHKAPRSDEKV
ncbi:hypothetical protein D3C78_1672430 [compost metagenome]